MPRWRPCCASLVLLLLGSGCAQSMAIRQAPSLACRGSVLALEVDRETLTRCLGAAVSAREESDGALTETYMYVDGGALNHPLPKTLRVLLYTAGDFTTLFLSQLLAMPAEHLLLDEAGFITQVRYERGVGERWRVVYLRERHDDGDVVRVLGRPPDVAAAPPRRSDPATADATAP